MFAEWVEVRTCDTWLNLVAGRRRNRTLWIWIHFSSAASVHSGKSSNLFSSATRCCSALCCLPDGPLFSWWESKKGNRLLENELVLRTNGVDQALGICGQCSSFKSLMSPHSDNNNSWSDHVCILIWVTLYNRAPCLCAFYFLDN